MENSKHCNHCDLDLPRSQFYSDKKTKDGLTAYCKAYYAAYYVSNKERQQETSQRARLKRRYGLTVEQYEKLLALGCTVCGSHKTLHVDHCHETGNVRGVLCRNCNVALGHACDDPERLRALAVYLEEKRCISQGLTGPSY